MKPRTRYYDRIQKRSRQLKKLLDGLRDDAFEMLQEKYRLQMAAVEPENRAENEKALDECHANYRKLCREAILQLSQGHHALETFLALEGLRLNR